MQLSARSSGYDPGINWKRWVGLVAASATAAAGFAFGIAQPAQADASDGALTVTVVNDRNLNSELDAAAIDTPLDGVQVTATDADGNVASATTAGGVADIDTTDLVGGQYRVEVTNPDPATYTEAIILDERDEAAGQFAPAVSFVDVSGGTDVSLAVGYLDYTTLGPENGSVFSAIQDNMKPGKDAEETTELYTVPVTLDEEKTALTQRGDFGTVYGIGVDEYNQDIYLGAYAKRAAAYGPGGPGAIYRYNFLNRVADPEPWAIVPDAGTDTHDWDDNQDLDYREKISRESLGDLDVTQDGKWLTVVNLATDSLVTYEVQETAEAPVQTLEVAAPSDCTVDWTPFALEEHDGGMYVGATCGETMEVYVLDYTRDADTGELTFNEIVAQGNADDVPTRHQPNEDDADFNNDGANLVADQFRNPNCRLAPWNPWNDDLAQVPSQFDGVGDCVNDTSHAYQVEDKDPSGTVIGHHDGNQITYPQPLLADIEVLNSGDFVLSFRDRGSDQYGNQEIFAINDAGEAVSADYITTGDQVRTQIAGGELVFSSENDFLDAATSNANGVHKQAAYAGIAYVEEGDLLVGNQMDAANYAELGLRVWDANTGTPTYNVRVTTNFYKNAGLSDVEVLVRSADQQIGDRIWIDADRDGIQDPGEDVVPGVLVGLYDAEGNAITDEAGVPVTTTTDARGEYHFDTEDGLLPETGYQVRVLASNFDDGQPLQAYIPTTTAAGDNRAIDSNGAADDSGDVLASVTTGVGGVNDLSIDFGFVPVVSIGDYVWFDEDNDGEQDGDEDGIGDVPVELYEADEDGNPVGDPIATTTTNEDGYYSFVDLVPGTDYVVQFPTTYVDDDGRTFGLSEPDADGVDDLDDTDADPASGRVNVTTPEWEQGVSRNSGEPDEADDPSIDAGYGDEVLVSIGDFVWLDDGDGVQGGGDDVALPDVTVELYAVDENGEPTGDPVATTTTNESGYYVFADLPTNTEYVVQFPTTYVDEDGRTFPLVDPNQGGDEAADSNAAVETGRSEVVTTPASGANSTENGEADIPTIDAGFSSADEVLVSIGDFVWLDDGDGVQGGGDDVALPDVTVELYAVDENGEPTGDPVATTTTNESGYYVFADLPTNTEYVVQFPTTYVDEDGRTFPLVDPNQGGDEAADSNPAAATGRSEVITTPASGANSTENGEADIPTIDAGYSVDDEVLVSIGDRVWFDENGNGTQDEGEDPIPDVVVELLDCEGNPILDENGDPITSTTDENGYYSFSDLPTNTCYVVKFPTTVKYKGHTYGLTPQGQDPASEDDSNPNPEDGKTAVSTPPNGENSTDPEQADDPSIDAGYSPLNEKFVSIGNKLWIDENGNGKQDDGEPAVPNVPVKLLDADGNEVAETTTDSNGHYVFTDLLPDTDYVVVFPTTVTVDGTTYSLVPAGSGEADEDSNPDEFGRAPVHTPAIGENLADPESVDDPTIDAGYAADPVTPVTPPADEDDEPVAPVEDPEDGLAVTGVAVGGLAGLAALLIAGGVALFVRGRRVS